MIQDAPLLVISALAVIILLIWRLMEWRYKAKNDLIAFYKSQLDGETSEEKRAISRKPPE